MEKKVVELREKFGRIKGFATLDVGLTIASAAAIAKYSDVSFINALVFLWLIGEGFHLAKGVDTPITMLVKGSEKPEIVSQE